jgi:hypothetical protein
VALTSADTMSQLVAVSDDLRRTRPGDQTFAQPGMVVVVNWTEGLRALPSIGVASHDLMSLRTRDASGERD